MRIFKTRLFAKWSKAANLSDKILMQTIKEVEQGLVDAELGGFLLKKRIALPGAGKRSGVRSIIAYKEADKCIFIFGFAKNEKDNLSPEELKMAKALARELFSYTDNEFKILLNVGKLIEVANER